MTEPPPMDSELEPENGLKSESGETQESADYWSGSDSSPSSDDQDFQVQTGGGGGGWIFD